MLSPNSEIFIKEVLSYVKFTFDRKDIRKEFEAHISDKIEYYTDMGYELEEAEQRSIQDMGDTKEIGTELNKQHNPVLGWLWRITNAIAILLFMLFCYIIFVSLGLFFSSDLLETVKNSEIVYQRDIDKRIKIDDVEIRLTNVMLEENGDLNIFYRYYTFNRWGNGGSFAYLGTITDDQGNNYTSLSGASHEGIITEGVWTITDFSKEANTVILTYDRYNRKYQLEIPIEVGGAYE
jgi:hypothetical protein